MRYVLAVTVLFVGLSFNSAWADTDKNMALEAAITMEQAIRTAIETMPGGKPYEVEMEHENGRVTYRVLLVDPNKHTAKVYVDAQTGKVVAKK